MSTQTNTLSRRHFLKGAVYTSALSMGGMSGAAIAKSIAPESYIVSDTTLSVVTLSNQSANAVALDAKQPVSLEKVDGWIVVKVNKAHDANSLTIEAGKDMSISVDGQLASMLTMGEKQPAINRTVFVGEDDFRASLFHATIA